MTPLIRQCVISSESLYRSALYFLPQWSIDRFAKLIGGIDSSRKNHNSVARTNYNRHFGVDFLSCCSASCLMHPLRRFRDPANSSETTRRDQGELALSAAKWWWRKGRVQIPETDQRVRRLQSNLAYGSHVRFKSFVIKQSRFSCVTYTTGILALGMSEQIAAAKVTGQAAQGYVGRLLES